MSELDERMPANNLTVVETLSNNNLTPTLLARYAREQGDIRCPDDIMTSYRNALEGEQSDLANMSDFLTSLCANLDVIRGRFSQIEWQEDGASYVLECQGHRAIVDRRRTGYAVAVIDEEGQQPCSWPRHITSLAAAKDRALVMLNASIERMAGSVPLMKVY